MWKKPANFLTFLFGVIPPVRCYPLLRYPFRVWTKKTGWYLQGYGSSTFLFMNIFASNFYTAYMEIPRYRIYKRKSPWPTIILLKKSKDYTPQETRSIVCQPQNVYDFSLINYKKRCTQLVKWIYFAEV